MKQHLHSRRDSFPRVTWLLLIIMCAIALSHVRDRTHSYAWYNPFICVTWTTRMCRMTHTGLGHDSFILRVAWLMHVCDMWHWISWWWMHFATLCSREQTLLEKEKCRETTHKETSTLTHQGTETKTETIETETETETETEKSRHRHRHMKS